MNYADDIALVISVLTPCVIVVILSFIVILKELLVFEVEPLKKVIAFIPRVFIKIFKIKHKHYYICTSCGDGGLAGDVACYECIWCGDTYVR